MVASGEVAHLDPALLAGPAVEYVDPAEALERTVNRVRSHAPSLEVRATGVTSGFIRTLISASQTADSIVVTGYGSSGMREVLVGSLGIQLASHAACPVVVVRDGPQPALAPHPSVVVGVDGSPVSNDAVGYAFLQASAQSVGLVVVHAWKVGPFEEPLGPEASDDWWARRSDPEQALTAEALAGWREKYPDVDVLTRVVRGRPVDALVAESEGAALVVVGSRGWGDLRGALLGSVSQGTLRRVRCPVAVVRPRAAGTTDEVVHP
jgi:nucleotide-binding universal stress UspA family protein